MRRSSAPIPARLTVSGHSAGGHLTAMALLTDWAGDYGLPADLIKGAVAISGLYDLGFLPYSYVQPKVQATWDQVARLSPIRHLPAAAPPLLVAVGGDETDEFRRQSRDFHAAWLGAGLAGSYLEPPGKHHLTVLEELENPNSELTRALVRIGQARLVDVVRLGHRRPQLLDAEIGLAGRGQDRRLAPGAQVYRHQDVGKPVRRQDYRAMAVGMDQVARADPHAVHRDLQVDGLDMRPGMAGSDASGEQLEIGGDHVQVADRAIGDAALHAQSLVHRRVDLAPEGAVARLRIEILDHGDGRPGRGGDMFVVGKAHGPDLVGGRSWALSCADRRGSGMANDGRQGREGADERPAGEAHGTPPRVHDLQGIAYRRRVERPQALQKVDAHPAALASLTRAQRSGTSPCVSSTTL